MSTGIELTTSLVGYQARSADGRQSFGEIQGVRPRGVRIHKIPGNRRHAGYLPAEMIARVDSATDTVFLRPGIELSQVVDAPPPPDESLDGWHMSNDWWADLLGHYGLYDAEGRSSEPYLHPDQR